MIPFRAVALIYKIKRPFDIFLEIEKPVTYWQFRIMYMFRPVCSHEGCSTFFRSPDRAANSERPIGPGDIRALCPELLGLYFAVDGVVVSRGDSEARLEHQTVKNRGDGPSYLGIGRT